MIEDLASNLSLETLRDIFEECLIEYHKLMKENYVACAEHPIDI